MYQVCFNGRFVDADAPLFTAANRGFRYGDGLFETAKLLHGQVLLFPLHCQRLQAGLALLQIDYTALDFEVIHSLITELCTRNRCHERARIRWAVYRQEDGTAGYVLEAHPLGQEVFLWQEDGWSVGVYAANKKSCDPLSNVKSANYLLYLLAAAEAKKTGMDECLVLNTEGGLCDGSRTNIFLVKNEVLYTPALHQGCVAGVMRRYLLECCATLNLPVVEGCFNIQDLLSADEVFMTNAIQGIRWVRCFEKKGYGHAYAQNIFTQALAPLYR